MRAGKGEGVDLIIAPTELQQPTLVITITFDIDGVIIDTYKVIRIL